VKGKVSLGAGCVEIFFDDGLAIPALVELDVVIAELIDPHGEVPVSLSH